MGRGAKPNGMKVAGKTGTAVADEGPWTHAWFAGYAPADDPKIVLVVFLEKGHGGSDAAGVAREIFDAFANSQANEQATGSKAVKRLTVMLALLLVIWARGDARARHRRVSSAGSWKLFPRTVRIRLWYLHPPSQLKLRPETGQATVKKCSTCKETSLATLSVQASGSSIDVDGDLAPGRGVAVDGVLPDERGRSATDPCGLPDRAARRSGSPADYGTDADGGVHRRECWRARPATSSRMKR